MRVEFVGGDGIDAESNSEGVGLWADWIVALVEKGQLEEGASFSSQSRKIHNHLYLLSLAQCSQIVSWPGVRLVNCRRVPEYFVCRYRDGEDVGWRGGSAGLEDAAEVGVVGVVRELTEYMLKREDLSLLLV